MLRRFAPRLSPFTSGGGGGSALHIRGCPPAGVYLPWTARPWEVTHRVHHSQWMFLDTVFAHLATVTPEELNTRAREQGVHDLLCNLEEPAMALRRQQTRQAWRQRQQAKAKAKAAKLEAAGVVASVTPAQASKKVPMARSLGEADSLSSHLSTSPSTRSATRGEGQTGSSWSPSTTATEKAVQEKDEEEKSGERWLKRSASSTKPAPTSSSIKSSASALMPAAHTQDAAEVKQDNVAIDTRRTEASSSSSNAGKKSKKSRKPRKSRLEDNSIVSAYFL